MNPSRFTMRRQFRPSAARLAAEHAERERMRIAEEVARNIERGKTERAASRDRALEVEAGPGYEYVVTFGRLHVGTWFTLLGSSARITKDSVREGRAEGNNYPMLMTEGEAVCVRLRTLRSQQLESFVLNRVAGTGSTQSWVEAMSTLTPAHAAAARRAIALGQHPAPRSNYLTFSQLQIGAMFVFIRRNGRTTAACVKASDTTYATMTAVEGQIRTCDATSQMHQQVREVPADYEEGL